MRASHALAGVSVLVLAVSGYLILMVHPRLYWGEAGNDLTPALLELPISRNHQHGGWTAPAPFFGDARGPVSAGRTFDIFNQNGWGRSLHFLAAWLLALTGVMYVVIGVLAGHFRAHFWPRAHELRGLGRDVRDHLRLRIPAATGGPRYGILQKLSYAIVVFLAAPAMVITGLAMAPAITAGFPFLLRLTGGYQSARTIHFFAFVALVLFAVVHVLMVVLSGFRRQIRGITLGERT